MKKKTSIEHLDGQRVRVYRNLHKGCYSVQSYETGRGWRVEAHVHELTLSDVEFKVMETGRQKVLRERKKNVHAFVIGTVAVDRHTVFTDAWIVGYNPYKYSSFVYLAHSDQPVYKAKHLHMFIGSTSGVTSMIADPIIEDTLLTNTA